MAESREVLIKHIVLDNLPFKADLFFDELDFGNIYRVTARMKHGHRTYGLAFHINKDEVVRQPSIHVYKAKALRKMLERQWAKILSGTFSVDVETDLQMAIEDAVSELREVTSAV